jgi:prepilin-type N-terminal cleavage/methylation domain-containing protein
MKKGSASFRNAGFTLIEVLVTVVVIGVLAAVVIPAVTAQVTAGDSARVIADLNNLRTGIENFDIAVRQFPGDVDDLVNRPGQAVTSTLSDADADIAGNLYASVTSWNGPYSEASLPLTATSSTSANSNPSPLTPAFKTGYAATINNAFVGCQIEAAATCTTGTSADYVSILVNTLTSAQLFSLNDLIDGVGEATSGTAGKFRYSGTATGVYFAAPFK